MQIGSIPGSHQTMEIIELELKNDNTYNWNTPNSLLERRKEIRGAGYPGMI